MNTTSQIGKQVQTTYEQYKKINTLVDVGFFLKEYVITGGEVTKDATHNNQIRVTEIVASLDNDVTRHENITFKTNVKNSIYYLDYRSDGNYHWGTSHYSGSYLPIAEITTDANGNVNVITDKRNLVGGFRLLDDYMYPEITELQDEMIENSNNLISSLTKRLQNGEITKIKLIGDSITEGYGATGHIIPPPNTQPVIFDDGAGNVFYEGDYICRCWANLFREWAAENFPDVSFTNAGIGGKTVTWGLANKQYWIGTEDVVFVMLGTNDKYHTQDITTYKSELIEFLAYVKQHSNLMIVMTAPPSSDDFDSSGSKNVWNYFTTNDIDRVITEVCAENKYSHISLYRMLLDYCKNSTVNPDHINSAYQDPHPNDFGHDLIWYAIQKNIGITDHGRMSNRAVFKQAIIDGNFQVAQTVPAVGTAVINPSFYSYPVFDMWKLEGYVGGGDFLPNITHMQAKITDSGQPADAVPGSKYCYRFSVDGAGSTANSQYNLTQIIYRGVSELCPGNTVLYASFWARSSFGGKKIQCSAYLDYGTGGSPSPTDYTQGATIVLSNVWRKYNVPIPIPSISGKTFGTNQDDYIGFRFPLAGTFQNFLGVGQIEITQVLLSSDPSGEFPVETFDETLDKCMKFYEKSYGYSFPVPQQTGNGIEAKVVHDNSIGNYQSYGSVSFKKRKSKVPSIVIYPYNPVSTNRVSNGDSADDLGENSGVAYNVGDTGFSVRNQNGEIVTTNNNLIQFHWIADCRI